MKYIRALLLVAAVLALAACDASTTPASNPNTVSRPAVAPISFPTPFPPMEYPTPVAEDQRPFSSGNSTGGGSVPSSLGASVKAADVGKVQQELLQVELDASKVRGLQPNVDVPEHFVTQAEMGSILLDQLQKSYPREQARLDELEYWLLRFTNSPGINLFQMQADLLSEQVVGLYDPEKKELFVLGGQSQLDPMARTTLAHEYVHSLQDQHYDLRRVMPQNSKDTDRQMGAQAVVEGDATLSELLYADQFLTADEFRNLAKTSAGYMDQNQLNSVPDVFRERLLFPYTYGLDFVKSLYARGGFETVNQAFKDPPVSTEQILHPEKYLAATRDDPKPVGVPPLTDTLGAGWVYRDTETIGEFELGLLLRVNHIPNGSEDVQGWGGGQYDLYENGANSLLILGTTWDTRDAAVGFDSALRQSLLRYPKTGETWSDGTRYFTTLAKGDRVFIIAGTDKASVLKAPSAIK